jgi:hypothetical protein
MDNKLLRHRVLQRRPKAIVVLEDINNVKMKVLTRTRCGGRGKLVNRLSSKEKRKGEN